MSATGTGIPGIKSNNIEVTVLTQLKTKYMSLDYITKHHIKEPEILTQIPFQTQTQSRHSIHRPGL